MAQHIDNVAGSSIRKVTKAQLYAACRPGDLVFCWGRGVISDGIEKVTRGPSHVLQIWTTSWAQQWLTFEATVDANVHYGRFSDYTDGYNGDIVLCRRPILTEAQIERQMRHSVKLLGEKYDAIEFASLIVRKVWHRAPLIQPARELYCSAAMQAISFDTVPFHAPQQSWNTPEDDFTDPTVAAVCALMEGTK